MASSSCSVAFHKKMGQALQIVSLSNQVHINEEGLTIACSHKKLSAPFDTVVKKMTYSLQNRKEAFAVFLLLIQRSIHIKKF